MTRLPPQRRFGAQPPDRAALSAEMRWRGVAVTAGESANLKLSSIALSLSCLRRQSPRQREPFGLCVTKSIFTQLAALLVGKATEEMGNGGIICMCEGSIPIDVENCFTPARAIPALTYELQLSSRSFKNAAVAIVRCRDDGHSHG